MQRLFSSFPDRAPGAGLVLLRLAICASLAIDIIRVWMVPQHSMTLQTAVAGTAAVTAAALLLAGLMTPLAGILAMAVILTISPADLPGIIAALSITLLGPGAFSIDARLFGRREIVITPRREHR